MDGWRRTCIKRAWRSQRRLSKVCITFPRGTGAPPPSACYGRARSSPGLSTASSGPSIRARTSSTACRAPAASGRSARGWTCRRDTWCGSPTKSRTRISPTRRRPWTLLWFRLDGPNLPAVRKRLFGAGAPRVSMPGDAILTSWFDRLFSAMRSREFGQDLRLNQLVGEFLVIVRPCACEIGRVAARLRRSPQSSRRCERAQVDDGPRTN